MMNPIIDLSKCKTGDILLTSQKSILRYLRPTIGNEYLDHVVEYVFTPSSERYLKDYIGTRTNCGLTYKNKTMNTAHDIIEIIHL